MGIGIKSFGTLQGIKVLSTGSAFAGPFAPTLFAENGAEVIHVESSAGKDTMRFLGYAWVQEHRNEHMIALDIPSPEGREVFLRMIEWCDIWVESSKGGTYDKWGLSDEVLWKRNPKLIIVHVSGFGQWGDPEYVSRASYDTVGQAFSGYANLNGSLEMPYLVRPYMCDFFTGYQVAWSALAAYIRTQKTGVGESIDVTQYEVMSRIQSGWSVDCLTNDKEFKRFSSLDLVAAGEPFYKCKNGKFVHILMGGAGPLKRGLPLLGLGDDPDFKNLTLVTVKAPYAEKFVQAQKDFCAIRTDIEVEKEMNAAGVPCCKVMDYHDILENPHYKARNNIIEYYDPNNARMIKGFAPSPKFKNNPQEIWCGGGTYGQDNELVLKKFGYSKEEIKVFYEKNVIAKELK